MTKLTEFSFPSTCGKVQLHAFAWIPQRDIVGIVQLAHGIAEHVARYDHLARYLNTQGFVVVGHDHLGHGDSLPSGGQLGYLGEGNTWETMVDDIHALTERIRGKYPGLPLFLLGHSMGSFLMRSYLITYPDAADGAILIGTAWQPAALLDAGLAATALFARLSGPASVSPKVTNLIFGAYNRRFAPNRTNCDWLSADEENVDECMADPLCGTHASTVSLLHEMLRGLQFNQRSDNLRRMNKRTPVFFAAGGDDPVGNMSKGVKKSYEAFLEVGMEDVSMQIYPGLRHEIHNEKAHRPTVYGDISGWLLTHLK